MSSRRAHLIALMWLTAIIFALGVAFTEAVYGQVENINIDAGKASAAPASLPVQVCQKGIGGQVLEGGLTILDSDAFCQYIQLAEIMKGAHLWAVEQGDRQAAEEYYVLYSEALDSANALVQGTATVSLVDRIARSLLIPVGVLVGLSLLL